MTRRFSVLAIVLSFAALSTSAQTVIFSDNMEQGTNGWTAAPEPPRIGNWSCQLVESAYAHSPSNAWSFSGTEGEPLTTYAPVLTSAPISLAGVTDAHLKYWLYSEFTGVVCEPYRPCAPEELSVTTAVLVNGQSHDLEVYDTHPTTSIEKTLNLTPYVGQTIRLQFKFMHTPDNAGGGAGQIVLDDVQVIGTPAGPSLPPDPSTVAPPIDPSVISGTYERTAFLYAGSNPIQTGVTPGAIKRDRAGVVRGRILKSDGTPLSGVPVTVRGQAELGQTLSRADGWYDLVINGGGTVGLQFARAGYITGHREVAVPWNESILVPDVTLLPYDTVATAIAMGGSSTAVARGSVQSDGDGTRRATLIFRPSTTATMTLPNGSTQPLATATVRATEYTVGPSGRTAMPADLPAASAYTYCVELSVDEAVSAGATHVTFSQAVGFYVENFLSLPVGTRVPVGYYERSKGVWVATRDGRVVSIVSIVNGRAYLDSDGDGLADPTQIAPESERDQLASMYGVGQTLWRLEVDHFSPHDANLALGLPPGAGPPTNPPALAGAYWIRGKEKCGSIIDCHNQALGESLAVTGTPFALTYRSDRVPGRTIDYTLRIPLTSSSLPAGLLRVELDVTVAGKRHAYTFPATPNQSYTFTWDGKDAYNRTVQGQQAAGVRIDYIYNALYWPTREDLDATFGLAAASSTPIRSARSEARFTQSYRVRIGALDARGIGLGGFTLSPHHQLDRTSGILYRGDGGQQRADLTSDVIRTVAGRAPDYATLCSPGSGLTGDGGPATAAYLCRIENLATTSDGSLYIAEFQGHRVRKVSPEGIITTVAGVGTSFAPLGDGGPATSANVGSPWGIAVAPDGTLYIGHGSRIRKVTPDGVITTIAGTSFPATAPDGTLAINAPISPPLFNGGDLELAPDGSILFAETNRVRRIGTDGVLTTVAGNGNSGYDGDGGLATSAALGQVRHLLVTLDGTIYVTHGSNEAWVRRIDRNGIISTIAGAGETGTRNDGVPALDYALRYLSGIAMGADGSLYVAENFDAKIHRITPDGIITTLAGTIAGPISGENQPAPTALIGDVTAVISAPNGGLYFGSISSNVRKIVPGLGAVNIGQELLIPSEDGSEAYIFSTQPRHLRTVDTLTGATLLTFSYDSTGRLSTVADAENNVTTVERINGIPTAIVSPYGIRTALSVDANGYLSGIQNPENERTEFTIVTTGLMTSLKDPRMNIHTFTYDPATGRLTKDEAPDGWKMILTRSDGAISQGASSFTVTLRSAAGRENPLIVNRESTGARIQRDTSEAGLTAVTSFDTAQQISLTRPDGTTMTAAPRPSSRFGMSAALPAGSVNTPSGITSQVGSSESVNLTVPGNPLTVASLTRSFTINSKHWQTTYDASLRRIIEQSPTGRTLTMTLDEHGRLTSAAVPGLETESLTWDTRGRLERTQLGTRSVLLTYNSGGLVSTIQDSSAQTVAFSYDGAGRVIQQDLPGNRSVLFGYDDNGNLTSLAPPGRPSHLFTYTSANQVNSYTAPGSPAVSYNYNSDRQLTQLTRADGRQAAFVYASSSGRLESIVTSHGTYAYTYQAQTGRVESIAAPGPQTVTYSYDGLLPTTMTWAGTVAGSVALDWGTGLRLSRENGALYAYDDDGLLTGAGALSLTRNSQNGLLLGTSVGAVTDVYSYNTFGEVTSYAAAHNGSSLLTFNYARDNAGRITSIGAKSYEYDASGHLARIANGSTIIAEYEYDGNGNRTEVRGGTTITATYDSRDRLVTYGPITYTYTADGERATKTSSGATTNYEYDSLGNLRHVELPGGFAIDYVIDGQNRRVGKKVNGNLVRGWLYADQLRIVTELDGSNVVVSQFVYGSRRQTPDYMVRAGVLYRILCDHVGSPRLVIDATNGAVAQQMEYDEFGQILTDSNPGFQPFGFAGGLYDRDTGLVRFGARDYDPVTGRWTTTDPILFDGYETNLYTYAWNDPINFIDATGFAPGDPYSSPDAAARQAIADICGTSARENVEYAGTIYRRADRKYSYTKPKKGTQHTSDPSDPPKGTDTVAWYHTHGRPDPKYDQENFSPVDKAISDVEQVRIYLGTPTGRIKRYLPDPKQQLKGKVQTIGRCKCN